MLDRMDRIPPSTGFKLNFFQDQLLYEVVESQMYFNTLNKFFKTYFLILFVSF